MLIRAEYNYIGNPYVIKTLNLHMEPEDLIQGILKQADGLIDRIDVYLVEPVTSWSHKP